MSHIVEARRPDMVALALSVLYACACSSLRIVTQSQVPPCLYKVLKSLKLVCLTHLGHVAAKLGIGI